jgi:hypothetical protein
MPMAPDGCNRKLDEALSPAATEEAETADHLFGLQQMLPLVSGNNPHARVEIVFEA